MMDYERTEKELQQIFEEIQHSYKTLADNVFTLQEETLGLARTLFESSTERLRAPKLPSKRWLISLGFNEKNSRN